MNRCDQVHFIMGLVNILFQCTMTTQFILWVSGFHDFAKEFYLPIFFLNMFSIYCSYWMISWLCVVYCISIANYTFRLFLWLKKRLSAFLPHLLLLSISGSLVICIPMFWTFTLDPEERAVGNATEGLANINATLQVNLIYVMTANIFGCCLPVGLTLISLTLTISSLIEHIQNMKLNHMDLGQSKLQAHARAVKTMMAHLILALFFFIAEMFSITSKTVVVDVRALTCYFCILSYPVAQSVVIFQSNSKLRSLFIEMFCLKNVCNRSSQDNLTERVKAELQANG